MNVDAVRNKARGIHPLRTSQARSSSGIQQRANPGEASIGTVSGLPTTVPAPQTFNIEVPVNVHIDPLSRSPLTEPDFCETSPLIPFVGGGLSILARVYVDGTVVTSDTKCIPNSKTFDFGISLTSSGAHTVEVAIFGANSNSELGRVQQVVTVEGQNGNGNGGTECQGDDQCGEGMVCENGTCVEAPDDPNGGNGPILPCFLDPNRSCDTLETVGFTAFAIILILVVAGVVV